jgi:N6-adenosine-specific RNA methylase IME4
MYESKIIHESIQILGYTYKSELRWLKNGVNGIKHRWNNGRQSKLSKK